MLRGGDSLRRRLFFFGILTGLVMAVSLFVLFPAKSDSAGSGAGVSQEQEDTSGGWLSLAWQSLSLKFYNGVLRVYAPGLTVARGEGVPTVCHDLTALVYPAIACNEEKLWYESQEENLENFENLAAAENVKAKELLEENQKAAAVAGEAEAATESEKKEEEKEENQAEKTVSDAKKKAVVNRKKLEDFDYLRQTFYQVDNTTTIGKDQLNVKKLLGPNMKIQMDGDGPQILIYHTHSQEGYKDSKAGDPKTSVIGVGDYLTSLLEKKGFTVLHHKGKYDVGDRDHAYSKAAPAIEKLLKKNPTIQVVIDLHRDGVSEKTRLVTQQNGKKMAKIMFFNGLSRTTATGNIPYLKNPYIEDNLAFSFQMQLAAAEYYPDLTRKIYLKGYRFNMHFRPKSMLVEVGAQTNTFEEAKNSMEPLADLLDKVLKPETGH